MVALKRLPLLLAVVAVVCVLASCGGSYPVSGTVVGKGYSPEHYDPCASWAKVCFGDAVGPSWYILIQDNVDDDGYIWVSVSQSAYQSYKTGDAYP